MSATCRLTATTEVVQSAASLAIAGRFGVGKKFQWATDRRGGQKTPALTVIECSGPRRFANSMTYRPRLLSGVQRGTKKLIRIGRPLQRACLHKNPNQEPRINQARQGRFLLAY